MKDTPFDKANYQPIGKLLSKAYETIVHLQLNPGFEKKLSLLLCGFRSRYATHSLLLNLVNKGQNYLDKSGVIVKILMDLFKELDFLPH